MKAKRLTFNILFVIIIAVITSCSSSRKVVYFQDMPSGSIQDVITKKTITVQSGDQLSIMVYADNAELASAFNLNVATGSNNMGNNGNNATRVYTIDSKGYIKMPVLGSVKIAGLTREQISNKIESELTMRNLLRNPVVNVAFYNMYVSVLGEVGGAKKIEIEKDLLTLPELLSQCGDLTINGKRETVKIIRDKDGQKTAYTVNLRSGESVYQSPAYYLQPNDLVYIEPNSHKTSQSVSNGSAMRTPAFWMSLVSFATSMAYLFK